jgi:hypothetical protein
MCDGGIIFLTPLLGLSAGERWVLGLLRGSKPLAEIADELNISDWTTSYTPVQLKGMAVGTEDCRLVQMVTSPAATGNPFTISVNAVVNLRAGVDVPRFCPG